MDLEKSYKNCFKFYCPLCGHHQQTKTASGIGLRHHLQFALATFVFCYFTWLMFGLKGVFIYLVFWGITEFALRAQRRLQWVCEECGFDPFLYKRDPNLMREAVQKYIQSKIDLDEKFDETRFRNYRSRKELEKTTQDAASKTEEGIDSSASENQGSTLAVDSDFTLVEPNTNIDKAHRAEIP